jgi:hypothetical protein
LLTFSVLSQAGDETMTEPAEEVVEAGRGIRFTRKTNDSIPVLDFGQILSGRIEDQRRLPDLQVGR